MRFLVRVAIAITLKDRQEQEDPFDRIYDSEIEAENALQACDIVLEQTNRIYPDAFIATTVKELI